MHARQNPRVPVPSFIHTMRTIAAAIVAAAMLLAFIPYASASAQELPPPKPVEIPCATNVSAQTLAATPVGDGSQSLVLVRVIIGPGGSIGEHTHPGTLAVVIEQGTFGLTLVQDGEMMVTRAATADTEATTEHLVPGEMSTLNPGDSFIEMGMVHSATNLADGDTAALISGLIETGQPLTTCVDAASTAASSHAIRGNYFTP